MSINRVIISGNLTRDAETRSTASGLPVLGIGVAVNDRRKSPETGEWEDHPNYIDCTMFGPRAESLKRYLVKGTKVVVAGKLRWSQWKRDGQKRSKVDVVVEDIDFMMRSGWSRSCALAAGGSEEHSGSTGCPSPNRESPSSADGTSAFGGAPDLYDEEIPF